MIGVWYNRCAKEPGFQRCWGRFIFYHSDYIALCHRTTFSQWQGTEQLASVGKWWQNWWNSLFLLMFILMPRNTAFSVCCQSLPWIDGTKGTAWIFMCWSEEMKSLISFRFGTKWVGNTCGVWKGGKWHFYCSLSYSPLKGVGVTQWRIEADKKDNFYCDSQNWTENVRKSMRKYGSLVKKHVEFKM